MQSTQEQWRPVVGYEGRYEVSDHGRVKSLAREVHDTLGRTRKIPERNLRVTAQTSGHLGLGLSKDGHVKSHRVHRLVLEAFVGPCPKGMEACHNDGDPTNNLLSNLRWDTHEANVADTKRHGRNRSLNVTHCPQGHEYTAGNTYFSKLGRRTCRACTLERQSSSEARRRERERNATPEARERARQKYLADIDGRRSKSRDSMREWRKRNPETSRERAREYRERNREAVNRRARERRAAAREAQK